jgi:energy-converting hydrogenase Eha subunit B
MIRRKIAKYLAGRKYIIEILNHPTDLSEFKERPTKRVIAGLILMGFSYIIGWPAVAALSLLAAWLREPMIAVIGCPTTYALSHLVFFAGAWLARAPHYIGTLARYTVQLFLRKILS